MSNKIKYGLKNVHYAVITNNSGVISFATPVRVPGAVNLALSAAGEKVEFYADDDPYFITNTNAGYDGDLEMALIPDTFRVDVLGETIDANGAQIENANVIPKDFALLFEFNGDANATRHVMYNVNAARPNVEGSTKTKTLEPKTESLSITASPAIDTANVKAKLKPTDTGYDTFYTAVYLENAVTNSLATASSSMSKATATDLAIAVTTTDANNAVKDVKFNGVSIGGANMSYVKEDPTIKTAYITGLATGIYVITVEFVKGNAVTYTFTLTA
jgi:phi13 family phage major tail protein